MVEANLLVSVSEAAVVVVGGGGVGATTNKNIFVTLYFACGKQSFVTVVHNTWLQIKRLFNVSM